MLKKFGEKPIKKQNLLEKTENTCSNCKKYVYVGFETDYMDVAVFADEESAKWWVVEHAQQVDEPSIFDDYNSDDWEQNLYAYFNDRDWDTSLFGAWYEKHEVIGA